MSCVCDCSHVRRLTLLSCQVYDTAVMCVTLVMYVIVLDDREDGGTSPVCDFLDDDGEDGGTSPVCDCFRWWWGRWWNLTCMWFFRWWWGRWWNLTCMWLFKMMMGKLVEPHLYVIVLDDDGEDGGTSPVCDCLRWWWGRWWNLTCMWLFKMMMGKLVEPHLYVIVLDDDGEDGGTSPVCDCLRWWWGRWWNLTCMWLFKMMMGKMVEYTKSPDLNPLGQKQRDFNKYIQNSD